MYEQTHLEGRPNPFRAAGSWWWADEANNWAGPYSTQRDALHDLLNYLTHQRGAPTRWERFKALVARFIRST